MLLIISLAPGSVTGSALEQCAYVGAAQELSDDVMDFSLPPHEVNIFVESKGKRCRGHWSWKVGRRRQEPLKGHKAFFNSLFCPLPGQYYFKLFTRL